MNLIESDNQILSARIYITPPSNINDSDEDSGEEDEVNVNNLTGRQLLANAEARVDVFNANEVTSNIISLSNAHTNQDLAHNENIVCNQGQNYSDCQLSPNSPQLSERQSVSEEPPTKKRKKVDRKWEKRDILSISEKEWEVPGWLHNSDKTPIELFESFYDDDVITLICNHTNNYAMSKGLPSGYTIADIRCFIGILLVTGYCQVPRVKMYWEMKDDVWNKSIAEAMPRNKFLNIMRCFHVCNNDDLDSTTKFAKVSPLWKMLNERWLKFYAGDVNLSVDESMIPYYGRHSTKQHIHGKPIRFGYKAWCLCTRFGYLVQAQLYEGANTGNKYPEVGVGGSVVLNLCDNLPARHDGYNIYFDNFFSSVTLLEKLKEKGHTATGTIRTNRVENAPLTHVKEIQKLPRGSFEQVTEKDSNVTLVRYHDNNVVTVTSTAYGAEPVTKVRRWSAAERKHISVNQPSCVVMYNQYMGGVDRLDENVSKLRIGVRGKKWYWQLLMFPINVSVNNAWILFRWTNTYKTTRLDLLSFTREISLTYLKKYSSRLALGRPIQNVSAVDKRVTKGVRFDNIGHLISKGDKQTRCGECKKNTTMKCVKCDVALHSKCFVLFHSRNNI